MIRFLQGAASRQRRCPSLRAQFFRISAEGFQEAQPEGFRIARRARQDFGTCETDYLNVSRAV